MLRGWGWLLVAWWYNSVARPYPSPGGLTPSEGALTPVRLLLHLGESVVPTRDIIHDAVKNALIKDGWTITADPYVIAYEDVTLFADLGVERPLAAERAGRKIVVEVKASQPIAHL